MSRVKKGRGQRSDDTMDDDSDDKDTKRKSRNLSEKKRRDQFNLLVNELSSMVSPGGKKMDKSTVLKATILFLKNHNEIDLRSRVHEIQEDWKPPFLTNEEFTHLVLEAVDGFIMVFSPEGYILYASESITSILGHLPNEILNMTIYEMACEEDQDNLYSALLCPVEEDAEISFSCHLRRAGTNGKQRTCLELVNFIGYFRTAADIIKTDNMRNDYSGEADTRLLFVGTGRLQTPQLIREMSVVDSAKNEFTSRHSLEWKFLFLDHRAPPIIGYLPFELLGTSGYDYYHVDDLDIVVNCHEALMQKGEGTSCYYRFLTKGQQWIWLQTRFYITYHQWNSKPEFIVCTHRVVNYIDVLKHSRKQKDVKNGLVVVSPPLVKNVPTAWPNINKSTKESVPMSADSPDSKLSIIKQSMKSRESKEKSSSALNQSKQEQPRGFTEPPQYVVPIEPIIANFQSPVILTQLQPTVISNGQVILHADVQKKHAELQASIGQQQAELRMVSEQLLMARLGYIPNSQVETPHINGTPAYNNSGAVSSTTATLAGQQVSRSTTILANAPLENEILALNPPHVPQHQPNVLYTPPDSNTPPTLAELK